MNECGYFLRFTKLRSHRIIRWPRYYYPQIWPNNLGRLTASLGLTGKLRNKGAQIPNVAVNFLIDKEKELKKQTSQLCKITQLLGRLGI